MEAFITIIGIAAALGAYIYIAVKFNEAANDKGYDGNLYGWLCFLFSFGGWILVAALPDKKARMQQKRIADLLEKSLASNGSADAKPAVDNSPAHAMLQGMLPEL